MTPHLHALIAPWQQRRSEGRWFLVIAVGIACAVPALFAAWQGRAEVLVPARGGLAVLLVSGWMLQFASLVWQNHPNAARLVPGHLRTLRETAVALWLLILAAVGLLAGPSLAAALAAGALMLVLALLCRYTRLWWLMSALGFSWGLWMPLLPRQEIQQRWADAAASSQLAAALGALLVMAWALSRVLADGNGAHRRAHAQALRAAEGARRATEGRSSAAYIGGPFERLGTLFGAPYRLWMARLLRRADNTRSANVLSRAELGLGASAHWTAHALGGVVFIGIALLSAGIAHFGFGLDVLALRGWSLVGVTLGAWSAASHPVLSLRTGYHGSRREQALLMLLPGMPRGAALNRALARRHLLQTALAWLLALALLVLVAGGTPAFLPSLAFGLGSLPMMLTLWRDWSRLPAPGSAGHALAIVAALLLSGGGGLLAWQLQPTLATLLAVALPPTLALGLWRWRQLAAYPQAFPVARRA